MNREDDRYWNKKNNSSDTQLWLGTCIIFVNTCTCKKRCSMFNVKRRDGGWGGGRGC